MIIIHDYQVKAKAPASASVLIQHVRRIINNNKTPAMWTEQERKNPVVFDKQLQTFISMDLSVTKDSKSSRMLSGGNFEFGDNIGAGYFLELKYRENDDAVKAVVHCIREMCKFSCIPGNSSTTCFLSDADPSIERLEGKIQAVVAALDECLSKARNKPPTGSSPA